jgi:hypothetical protein
MGRVNAGCSVFFWNWDLSYAGAGHAHGHKSTAEISVIPSLLYLQKLRK